MRILISSDWQCEYSNIEECKIAWKFALKICKEKGLEAIVLAGDLKHAYNPVDVRVIKFWQNSIEKAIENKLRVIVLLGNHDREGLHSDSKNWLPILRRAGAEIFDKPSVCELIDGKIAMLPFSRSKPKLRENAKFLSKLKWDKYKDILLFHAEVKGALYSHYGIRSASTFSYADLHPEKYLACVGGHIHHPQEIGDNGYYVGSPFCCDWGEANQRKRFIILRDSDISSIDSSLPGWFDPDVSGFYKVRKWQGCRLRLHAKVTRPEYLEQSINKVLLDAEHRYPGAIIKVIPEFESEKVKSSKVNQNDSDENKIKSFVEESIPDKIVEYKDKIINLLCVKLKQAHGIRRHVEASTKFISFEGENVLSFKKVEIIFKKQGLVVIEGTNKDWANQSNGSGKTNYVQTIPVSLFGTTFKGQKFDKWARRHTKGKAVAKLKLENASGETVVIVRGRRPTESVSLTINGQDHSSGIGRSKETDTQARISSITGFTWETLANSVYIDRSIANKFLTGKKSDRIDLLYRFQNLERFSKALKLVRDYKHNHDKAIAQTQSGIDVLKAKVEEGNKHLSQVETDSKDKIEKLKNSYRIGLKQWKKLYDEKNRLRKKASRIDRSLRKRYDSAARSSEQCKSKIDKVKREAWKSEHKLIHFENISTKGVCPTCTQKVDKGKFKEEIKRNGQRLQKYRSIISTLEKEERKYNEQCALLEGEIDKYSVKAGEAKSKADAEQSKLLWIKKQINELRNSETKSINKLQLEYKKNKENYKDLKKYYHQLIEEKAFIEFCEFAFSKDGIPAYLNAQQCPILNKFAEYYSDKFCDKEVIVRFEMEEGDLVPKIINPNGGEELSDQSNGEATLAGLITSFTLKEIAPKTNVLVLDEPEAGLSPENIRRFARELVKLKDKYESIFVVTHSPIMLSELENEKVIKIVKHHGISKVVN